MNNSFKSTILNFLFLSCILFVVSSCQKDSHDSVQEPDSFKKHNPVDKTTICLYDKRLRIYRLLTVPTQVVPIMINDQSVVLDDADNDGFFPQNECGYGPMGDCDDTNGSVNPESSEICDNAIDDDCNGAIDDADENCQTGCQPVCPTEIEVEIVEGDINCPPFQSYTLGWSVTIRNNGGITADRWTGIQAWMSHDAQLGNDLPAGGRIINTYLENCEETSFSFGATFPCSSCPQDVSVSDFSYLLLELFVRSPQTDCDMSNNLLAIPIPQNYPQNLCSN